MDKIIKELIDVASISLEVEDAFLRNVNLFYPKTDLYQQPKGLLGNQFSINIFQYIIGRSWLLRSPYTVDFSSKKGNELFLKYPKGSLYAIVKIRSWFSDFNSKRYAIELNNIKKEVDNSLRDCKAKYVVMLILFYSSSDETTKRIEELRSTIGVSKTQIHRREFPAINRTSELPVIFCVAGIVIKQKNTR
jgi:hypothetical protein